MKQTKPPVHKARFPGGYVVEIPRRKWKAATAVVSYEGDGKLLVLIARQSKAKPEPTVYGMFVLMPSALRQLARIIDAVRKNHPDWLVVH